MVVNSPFFDGTRFRRCSSTEAAGAVGVLDHAVGKTGLAETEPPAGLLHRPRSESWRRRRLAGRCSVDATGRLYLGKHARRNIELIENPLIPLQRHDVEQQRARGVGYSP